MNTNLLFLSIGGLASGLSQILNKKLAQNRYTSTSFTTVVMLFNTLLSVPLLFINFHVSSSLNIWFLIFASIVVFAFSTFFSFQAYKHTDVSMVSILQRLNIVFVAIIGVLLLGEDYSLKASVGLLLIFFSGALLVFEGFKLKLSTGIIYALLMALTGSIASVLDKIILSDFSPYTYVFVNNLLVGSVFLVKRDVIRDIQPLLRHHIKLISLISFLTTLAFILVLLVLNQTNVSQTMPAYKGLSLLTPVLFGIIFLKEKKGLVKKLIATILGMMGIILLY